MSGSQKSRDDLAKFRRVSFRFVAAAPGKASKGVSDFASAKALLDVQPERHLKLTSALTIWPKSTSLPEPFPNPVSTSFSIEWVDHTYFKDHSIRGTLETVDADAKDGLWQEWLDWLTIAGDAVEFCEIPQGCSESLPLVPHPLNRWLYLVHEFAAPGLFTWDLTPSQLNDWQQRCNEVGFGEIRQTEVDSHGTRSHWLGAAAGERLRVEGPYSLQEFPASFHVCSEIRNLIHESRKLLSVLEPKSVSPITDGPSGVSLRDVAAALSEVQGDDDANAIGSARVRWNNTRQRKSSELAKLPEMLGKCAADNRAGLFGLSAILDFVKKEDGLPESEISAMKRLLKPKLRPIGDR